jgi:hypothetical protein
LGATLPPTVPTRARFRLFLLLDVLATCIPLGSKYLGTCLSRQKRKDR